MQINGLMQIVCRIRGEYFYTLAGDIWNLFTCLQRTLEDISHSVK